MGPLADDTLERLSHALRSFEMSASAASTSMSSGDCGHNDGSPLAGKSLGTPRRKSPRKGSAKTSEEPLSAETVSTPKKPSVAAPEEAESPLSDASSDSVP